MGQDQPLAEACTSCHADSGYLPVLFLKKPAGCTMFPALGKQHRSYQPHWAAPRTMSPWASVSAFKPLLPFYGA